jgi:SAM-dependent methyltransferase
MGQDERWDDIWSEKRRLSSGKFGSLLARDIIYRTVAGILKKEIPDASGMRILEPGSGTGLASLGLAERGAEVFLLDLSPEAVRFSRAAFEREHTKEATVQATILDLPFKDNAFDVTWNGGVIEHFKPDDQVRILNEMLRVTKPGGKVIVIVPSADGRIYCSAKAYADGQGLWRPGYEVPLSSLESVASRSQGRLIREYRTGLLAQLHFLKYYFAGWRPLWLAWCGLIEIISLVLSPLNNLPGYLLVAILEKN